ncbi:MAG: MMPL family transporter [Deltaproteobacteria bacterium]|nr:MMPL family transporter [Deltaproteobacteria bacterium]
MFSRLVDAIARRPGPILVIALLLALPSTYWSALLFGDLRADLRELLPEHAESVETLKNLERRFGGWSQLSIVIRSPDRAANRRFSDDLVQKLEKVEAIRSVRNKLGPEYDFFGERRFLYVELKDLVEVEERIEDAIQDAKLAANPLYVDLEEGAKKPQKLDFSDIQKKYEARLELAQRFPYRYFESQDGGQLAVIVRQRGLAFGIERNRALVKTVEALAKELGPASYHPSLEVGLGGDVKNLIEESDSLLEDLVTATVIVFVLLGAVVLIYYRRFRAVIFLAVPVFVGSVLTFGLSHFLIGYVNASSAFLGPIVPGNGINFGIILLARYIEERKAGLEVQAALHQAVGFTVRGTSVAAFGAAVAYGSLIATDFLGFRHFGVIGGLGMVFCWISTFTVLPALISWSEARWPLDPNKERFSLYRSGQLAALPARFATWARVPLSILGIVSFVVGSVAAQRLFADPFEKDFGKLRNLATHERGAAYWESQVDLIFGRYLAPQVIVVEQESDIPRVIEHLERSIKDGGERAPIVEVSALQGFVPPDQPQKIDVLNRIRELLSDDLLAQLDEADRKLALEQRPPDSLAPFTVKDLPESIRADFRELDGTEGLVVLALPNLKLNLYHADEVKRVAAVLREIPLPDGRTVKSSGAFVIYSDMVEAVGQDGPKATAYSLLGVVLVTILAFRSLRRTLFVLAALFLGVAGMFGVMGVMEWKINFLNFIALPITFGIGVDYAVNVYSRYLIERMPGVTSAQAAQRAVASSGGAVILCSLTTVIGYASLLVARNGALISFGEVAIVGELTCLFAAILVLPAWLAWIDR